jgi:iron complex outermembrane receptor protein
MPRVRGASSNNSGNERRGATRTEQGGKLVSNKMSLRGWLLAGAAGVAGVCWTATASAQQSAAPARPAASAALEEVVVTARKREENLQTTPVAITAVTAQTLERRNIVNLEQIARLSPNVVVYQTSGGIGGGGNFIRGIGYADVAPGQDNPIGIYIDGVIAGRNGIAMMSFVAPDRIEVLRGPQGTLFGRNTTGGAILITTHTPSDEFGGSAKASYGSFGQNDFQARIDTGLLGGSSIKLSAAFQHHHRDGTFNATTRPSDLDPGAEDSNAYWFKAMGTWDKLSATVTGDYSKLMGVPAPLQVVAANPTFTNFINNSPSFGGNNYPITTKPLYTLADAYPGQEQWVRAEGISLTLNYELNRYLSLKSISALREFKTSTPSAYGPTDLRANAGTAAAPRIVSYEGLFNILKRFVGQRQRSEELQLLGAAGDFNYVGGFYYFDEDAWEAAITRTPVLAAGATAPIESISSRDTLIFSKSMAAFAQVDYRPSFLDKKLELTGGLRWTEDKRDFTRIVPALAPTHLKNDNTSFLVSASYQWTPGAMTFVRYSTAYRAGGLNIRAPIGSEKFLPEHLKSLEAGFKLDFLDNRVRLNGAGFYNTYEDLQTGFFVATGTSTSANAAVNANARYKGFELELEAVPIDHLTLTASVGHVDREYTRYPQALGPGGVIYPGCTALPAPQSLTTQNCAAIAHFQYTPANNIDVSASYVIPEDYGQWSIFAAWSYKSKVYSATFNLPNISPNFNLVNQDGYGLLSARISLSDIKLSGNVRGQISVFGDNLTDKAYNIQGIDFVNYATVNWGTRRTVGVEGKVEF